MVHKERGKYDVDVWPIRKSIHHNQGEALISALIRYGCLKEQIVPKFQLLHKGAPLSPKRSRFSFRALGFGDSLKVYNVDSVEPKVEIPEEPTFPETDGVLCSFCGVGGVKGEWEGLLTETQSLLHEHCGYPTP